MMPICAIQHRSITGRFVPIHIKILRRQGPCFDKHNFIVHWIEWQVKQLRKNLYAKFNHADKVYIDGDNVQILFKPQKISSDKVTFQTVTEGDGSGLTDLVPSHETEGGVKKDSFSLVKEETPKTYAKQNNKLYRDSCGHACSRQTSTTSVVTCEREECTSLSKCVCGSGSVSTSCSRKKKSTRKKRRKDKPHLTMLKKNICEVKDDCYHGDNNINTSVFCSARGKEKNSSKKDFNSFLRSLHNTSTLCVQLILLLLVLVFAAIFEYTCYPMMNVHNELPATFIQRRRSTDVDAQVVEINSFLQYCGECNGLVKMLLLLLAGDVEVNPGPDIGICAGWDVLGDEEINSPDITAADLRSPDTIKIHLVE